MGRRKNDTSSNFSSHQTRRNKSRGTSSYSRHGEMPQTFFSRVTKYRNLPTQTSNRRNSREWGDGARGRRIGELRGNRRGKPEEEESMGKCSNFFGFKKIESLIIEHDSNKVISIIHQNLDSWSSFLESSAQLERSSCDDVLLRMVVHLLGVKLAPNDVTSAGIALISHRNTILLQTLAANKFKDKIMDLLRAAMWIGESCFGKSRSNASIPGFDSSTKGLFKDVYQICNFCAFVMPETAKDYVKDMVQAGYSTLMCLKLKPSPLVEEFTEMAQLYEELIKMLSNLMKNHAIQSESDAPPQKRSRGFTDYHMQLFDELQPSSDYRSIPIIPPIEELKEGQRDINIRPNKVIGSYNDASHYLDIHFRLLREDFVRPLREGVQEFLRNSVSYLTGKKRMPLGSVRVYYPVNITGVEIIHGIGHSWLKLPENVCRRTQWDKSKRLLSGNLLILTNPTLEFANYGVVGVRDDGKLHKDCALSFIPEGIQHHRNKAEEFLLIESDIYFEAYRHVLRTLQTITDLQNYPMAKYIVESKNDVNPPAYLIGTQALQEGEITDMQEDTIKTMTILFPRGFVIKTDDKDELNYTEAKNENGNDAGTKARNLLELQNHKREKLPRVQRQISPLLEEDWPTAFELGLDENQHAAFKAALTQELCVIQGPPGTGKTYIGLRIAEILLKNTKLWMNQYNVQSTEKIKIRSRNQYEIMTKIRSEGPIVVVCYTNHALDQFLEGIVDIYNSDRHQFGEPRVLRVGGRSKSTVLQKFSLQSQRENGAARTQRHKVKEIQDEVYRTEEMIQDTEIYDGIMDLSCFPVWEELIKELPTCLVHCIQDPAFFGICEKELLKSNFNARKKVEDLLGPPTKKTAKQVLNQKNGSQDVGGTTTTEGVAVEEYDLAELTEKRIINDYVSKRPTRLNNNSCWKIAYGLHGLYSGADCILVENWLNEEEARLQRIVEDLVKTENPNDDISQRRFFEASKDKAQLKLDKAALSIRRQFLNELKQRFSNEKIEISQEKFQEDIDELWRYDSFESCENLYPTFKYRWALYNAIITRVRHLLKTRLNMLEQKLIKAEEKFSEIRLWSNMEIVKHCHFVGLTTTGAAKNRHLLVSLNSKIVIVEEAAEVLESHIVTCLTNSCQHLILIGDHLQLKPNSTVNELSKKYNLDVSLFERMLKNKINCYRLKTQHRMRPEISDLVRGSIYSELVDAPVVTHRKPILGVRKNLFFLSHNEKEESNLETLSKSNMFEVDFLFGLTRYLLQQGNSPEQITVLSTYTGQMFKLKSRFRELVSCARVKITFVDNYQGEENDIILLSLVRSNEDCRVGFLSVENRVCVALSRAKAGLFIVGNMDALHEGSQIWKKINSKLTASESIGRSFPIICQVHGTTANVSNGPEFLLNAPEGGCNNICSYKLQKCPHSCPRLCHLDDRTHEKYRCTMPCFRNCGEDEEHGCGLLCYQKCLPCNELVNVVLDPCGHDVQLPCSKRRSNPQCTILVTKRLNCGHSAENQPCHIHPDDIRCRKKMDKFPPCGKHLTRMFCYVDPTTYRCEVKQTVTLHCGHEKTLKCYLDPASVTCTVQVKKTLTCGHKQKTSCWLTIDEVRCETKIDIIKEPCKHPMKVLCKYKDTMACYKNCETRLNCGHQCIKNCHALDDPDHLTYSCKKNCARSCKKRSSL